MSPVIRRTVPAIVLAGAMMLAATGCLAGERAGAAAPAEDAAAGWSSDTLSIDFATYNPLSLVVKDQRLLEEALGEEVTVEWVQSAGSNKANELLRSGSLDVGSTAGSAALLARANGSPIQVIDVYSQPEWSAIVVPAGSPITSVADLRGATIAATAGTDPYFFLLQALVAEGLSVGDVAVQNLQHADGRAALEAGSVDAWAGLDPIMAAAEVESGATLLYRDVEFNSFGFLNATEEFITEHPDLAQVVVDAYEQARTWAIAHPEETAELLAEIAGIDLAVATTVIRERTNLDVDGVPGAAQRDVLERIAPVLVDSDAVSGGQAAVDAALQSIVHPDFARAATE
ncbi:MULTISPECIES: aliphatic sulfonate ABC transporter substrate-binding protein [Microbacterium]|uniref:Aliphatic sulfonate ABC transporter substrate-binding protein n=1 Tax=Microbacterium wangchenii TaxID=2541726 RepID=A0ABX5SV85_9MICO|nr:MULTISPECIES: aliphatic sulfonate ABC transporter substrate-binding protein [Microbacterium]MCK6065298.1 aliphatic sulfonate ABC transporter substrate-binding protein [Microbacterium sp. EYE_512]QBR88745.1 aliphatic sulfonate ABC transporter substrate-binding protein [Microbacterium wangchenii]